MTCTFCNYLKKGEILGESERFYAVPAFGQISDGGHILVLPKKHYSCLGAMPENMLRNLEDVLNNIKPKMKNFYKPKSLVSFEHGIFMETKGHAHLNLVPAPINIRFARHVRRDFENRGIAHYQELQGTFQANPHYLFFEDQHDHRHTFLPPEGAVPNQEEYLRMRIAEAMGKTGRACWRTYRENEHGRKRDDAYREKTIRDWHGKLM